MTQRGTTDLVYPFHFFRSIPVGGSYTNLNLQHAVSLSSGTQRKLLPLGFCCRDLLNIVEIDFRVDKLFGHLDLQAPVFVGNDVFDKDRLAAYLDPDCGFRLVGGLWGRVLGLLNAILV